MGERPSEYARDSNDWYVEPASCVDVLLDRLLFPDGLHDPCCGSGTIVRTASARGIRATGADLVDRADGAYLMRNFLTDDAFRPNIVCNPPFKIAVPIVEHALRRSGGRVAIIAQAKFLFSQSRHPLFTRREMERVIVLSRRPSMPPGQMLAEQGEACRGGGSIDFVWIIWNVRKEAGLAALIEWAL